MSRVPESGGKLKRAHPLRKAGAQSTEPVGSLPREDYIVLMPHAQFEQWCADRLAAVAHDGELAKATTLAIEADRRLRAERREEGRIIAEAQRARLTNPPTESPMESRLLLALFASGAFERVTADAGCLVGWGAGNEALFAQLPLVIAGRSFRLDFAVVCPPRQLFLAIEVDGRNWHDRTPEQGTRDRRRDRSLAAAGWQTVRFSGTEVHHHAAVCADEVIATIRARSRAAPIER